MSQTTKRALEASFKKLLLEKPLNKITINDITEDCGVNRMTFYYHFKDIYDLVDWILAEDAAKAMEGRRGFGTWSEAYLDVLRQLQDNKTLVLNVYRSVGREQVEQYLYRLLDPILKDFADRECHDITVQDADKQFVVDFYKYAQHEPLGALGKDEPQGLQHGFHHLGLYRQKDQVAVPGNLGVGSRLTAQLCGQRFGLGRRAVSQKYILRLGSLAHSTCNSAAHVSTA